MTKRTRHQNAETPEHQSLSVICGPFMATATSTTYANGLQERIYPDQTAVVEWQLVLQSQDGRARQRKEIGGG